jgi:hypothetical protein
MEAFYMIDISIGSTIVVEYTPPKGNPAYPGPLSFKGIVESMNERFIYVTNRAAVDPLKKYKMIERRRIVRLLTHRSPEEIYKYIVVGESS